MNDSQLYICIDFLIMTVFTYSVGNTELTITSLNYYIFNTIIAAHWKDLGIELLKQNYVHELTNIEVNYCDVKICCREMFNYWLQVDCNANWNQLISALDKINLKALAKKIRDDVLKGIVNDYSHVAICCMFTWITAQ